MSSNHRALTEYPSIPQPRWAVLYHSGVCVDSAPPAHPRCGPRKRHRYVGHGHVTLSKPHAPVQNVAVSFAAI